MSLNCSRCLRKGGQTNLRDFNHTLYIPTRRIRSARTVKQLPCKPAAAFSTMNAQGPAAVWNVMRVA